MCNRKRRYRTNVFEDPAVRRRFVTKVLTIVAINLTITSLAMTICILTSPIRRFLIINWWIPIPAIVIIFIIHLVMCFCPGVFRKSPIKWILLVIYVICHAILVSCLAVRYRPLLVLTAFGICAFLVACLCLFARFAPCDFTSCYTLIFILILALLVLGILAIFIRGLRIVYICLGVIAYSIFIVYDLQLIIGGKIHKNQYDELDYIIASMILFHDVVHLFMFILQLAGWIDDD
ncbi:protein lifeguard 3-like [Drosophila suzukii]|uniref:Protein lifeguard 3-like n=1 Tax=Drosophila suzukii TaxID=28584 RepID=A0AB39Z425_DROSZ